MLTVGQRGDDITQELGEVGVIAQRDDAVRALRLGAGQDEHRAEVDVLTPNGTPLGIARTGEHDERESRAALRGDVGEQQLVLETSEKPATRDIAGRMVGSEPLEVTVEHAAPARELERGAKQHELLVNRVVAGAFFEPLSDKLLLGERRQLIDAGGLAEDAHEMATVLQVAGDGVLAATTHLAASKVRAQDVPELRGFVLGKTAFNEGFPLDSVEDELGVSAVEGMGADLPALPVEAVELPVPGAVSAFPVEAVHAGSKVRLAMNLVKAARVTRMIRPLRRTCSMRSIKR